VDPAPAGRTRRRLTAFTVVYVLAHGVALALLPLPGVRRCLAAFVGWIAGLGAPGAALMVALFVPATLLLVPPGALAIASGYIFGFPLGSAIATAGKTLGGTAAFLIARTLARDWVRRKMRGHPRLEAVDRAVGSNAFKVVALSRLSPVVPFGVINYTFGASDIRFGRYLAATFLGGIPLTLIDAYIGSAAHGLADLLTGGGHETARVATFAAGIAASVALVWIVHRAARRALGEAEALPEPAPA
jgi:uncharacterized membrane protein YdjX (TVP38/TMEM64 family)